MSCPGWKWRLGRIVPMRATSAGTRRPWGNCRLNFRRSTTRNSNVEISWLLAGGVHGKAGSEFYGFDEEEEYAMFCLGWDAQFTFTIPNRSMTWSGAARSGSRNGFAP